MAPRAIGFVAILLWAGALGCRSSPNAPACGNRDAGVVEVNLEAPPGCPPAPNELGIGEPCTMCGNECALPLRCTCDPYLGVQLVGAPCVCTKVQPAPTGATDPCAAIGGASFCGSNTTCCNVQRVAAYCVPNACLIDNKCLDLNQPDGGADGAAPDVAAD